ncbi:hypothetical protein H4R18_004500 [Coemansia javaensis]|uniref:Uncharacterized protein n=1 Tax=Coemansia javaensis TaxID=2761396 RepID=A0A9W8LGZ9_9FUNG|nr:hypothetical protein H4R18_004500 [Coemansia javaensis]
MLAIAAARSLRRTVAVAAAHGGRAGYQTRAEQRGPGLRSRGGWASRLLAYLQSGLDAGRASLGRAFSGTAAGRLRAGMMARGPAWRHIRPAQRLAAPLLARHTDHRLRALGQDGLWSPYANAFALAFRSRGAHTLMARISHQAAISAAAGQHRGLAIGPAQSRDAWPGRPQTTNNAQEDPADRCVVLVVPLAPPAKAAMQPPPGAATCASSAAVAAQLAGLRSAQSTHALLLSRLVERLSATGWAIHYRQAGERLEIAFPPSSGVKTAGELEALLCDWGLDAPLLAATVREPRSAPAASPCPAGASVLPPASPSPSDLSPELFSLIVDEIVDPEEAYREQVREFLADLERLPRLPAATVAPFDSPTSPALFL